MISFFDWIQYSSILYTNSHTVTQKQSNRYYFNNTGTLVIQKQYRSGTKVWGLKVQVLTKYLKSNVSRPDGLRLLWLESQVISHWQHNNSFYCVHILVGEKRSDLNSTIQMTAWTALQFAALTLNSVISPRPLLHATAILREFVLRRELYNISEVSNVIPGGLWLQILNVINLSCLIGLIT